MTRPRPLFVHLNANSLRNKVEEVRALVSGADVVSLQDYRLPSLDALRSLLPDFVAYGWPHERAGTGLALLVTSRAQQRELWRSDVRRHRCVAVEVRLPSLGNAPLTVGSYYAPPHPTQHLDARLLTRCLSGPRAVLLGDLNARHAALGCRTSNSNGFSTRATTSRTAWTGHWPRLPSPRCECAASSGLTSARTTCRSSSTRQRPSASRHIPSRAGDCATPTGPPARRS